MNNRNLNKLWLQESNLLSCCSEVYGTENRADGITHSESSYSGYFWVFMIHIEDENFWAVNIVHWGGDKSWIWYAKNASIIMIEFKTI